MKRKAKEQLASGLSDVKAAIAELDTDIPVAIRDTVSDNNVAEEAARRSIVNSRQIGEGRSAPLSKAQRKQAL